MSDVFISYSRKDIAFARLIQSALQDSQVDTWIDWDRIPVGEPWWREIIQAIESANVFLFIISRNSLGSEVCKKEIEIAEKNHKRIIPIVVDDLSPVDVQAFAPDLPTINWIIFEKDHIFRMEENPAIQSEKPEDRLVALPKLPQFEEALKKLSTAIHTDWEWTKYHTRLQVNALLWEDNGRDPSYLMRGSELGEAERRLLEAGAKDPQPTSLQIDYVQASRGEENSRQAAELALERKARQRQRLALWAVGIGLVAAIILGVLAWGQRNEAVSQSNIRATAESNAVNESNVRATAQAVAEEQKQIAEQQRNVAQAGLLTTLGLDRTADRLDLALLLTAAAYRRMDIYETRHGLLSALSASPGLQFFLYGHKDTINSLAISPDGTRIASASADGTVILWDMQTRQAASAPLSINDSPVISAAFSPDSKLLATGHCTRTDPQAGCAEGKVYLWEAASGKMIGELPGVHNGSPLSLAFSRDGNLLASGDLSGQMRLWNVAALQPLGQPFRQEVGSVVGLAFSPDGSRLLSAVRTMQFHANSVEPVTYNGKLRLWNVADQTMTATYADCPGSMHMAVTFGPDGSPLGAFDLGLQIYIWNLNQLNVAPRAVFGFTGFLSTLAFSGDGSILASGGCARLKSNGLSCIQGEARMWEMNSYSPIQQTLQGTANYVTNLALNSNGSALAANSAAKGVENTILVWDFSAPGLGTPVAQIANPGALVASPDGVAMAVGSGSQIQLLEVNNPLKPAVSLKSSGSQVTALAYSPDGQILASGDSKGSVWLWDVELHKAIFGPLEGQKTAIVGLVFVEGRSQILSVGADGSLLLRDTSTGKTIRRILEASDPTPTAVSLSPDGKMLAAAFCLQKSQPPRLGMDCTQAEIRRWNAETGQSLGVALGGYTSQVNALSFSMDGRWLASANCGHIDQAVDCDQGDVQVWDAAAGKLAAGPLTENTENVVGVAFSPDGKMLASLSKENRILLWDTGEWHTLGQLNWNAGYLPNFNYLLAFSADSKVLYNGSAGLTGWMVDPQGWQQAACRMANRDLRQEEWSAYLGDIPYQKTCSQAP